MSELLDLNLVEASKALKNKKIDALVTGPINKKNIQSDDFQFKGHTDFLDNEFQGESLMFMVSNEIKVALLTEHIPLSRVKDHLNKNLIEVRIIEVINSLLNDFGISRIIFTDINRDGMKTSPNYEETIKIAEISNCPVDISGGVSSLNDIKKAKDLDNKKIEGIIVGKAIYDGDIKLEDLAKEIN